IENRYVLLLDPMLGKYPLLKYLILKKHYLIFIFKIYKATGGSAIKAIEVLISYGVKEDKILFLNLIAAPEGIQAVTSKFSKLKIITAFIDQGLDEKKYIIPGLGDFGKSDWKEL
ncbi:8326_t:CDS:1, partial [Racocetra fulgida]